MNKIPLFLLMLVGEVLICMGTILLLGDIEPTNLLMLNVAVFSVVYLLIFSTCFDLFDNVNMERSSAAGMGLTLYGIISYTILSIGSVIAAYVWRWDLIFAIMAQGGALFVLFLFVILSNKAINSVAESMHTVESRKNSLRYAMDLLNEIEVQVKTNASQPHKSMDVDTIKEQLRYVTFSDRESAQLLDKKLIGAINELSHTSTSSDHTQWSDTVERCLTIIKLRKQQL